MAIVTECIDTGCLHRYWIPRQKLRRAKGRKSCWTFHFRIVPGPDANPAGQFYSGLYRALMCLSLGLPPLLHDVDDPIPLLQVFARQYRDGCLTLCGKPVRSRTMEETVRAIGCTFVLLGTQNPRLNLFGQVDERLGWLLAQWHQEDPEPGRVKPISIYVLYQMDAQALAGHTPAQLAIADMIWVGEYTTASEGSHPFWCQDAQLWIGQITLDSNTAPDQHLLSATHVTLEFTDQKNCVKGGEIVAGHVGSDRACVVRAVVRRIIHLREAAAPRNYPLCAYYAGGTWYTVTNNQVTQAICLATIIVGPQVGFLPSDVSAHSLCLSGAMAMLCAGIDSLIIKMLGRWRSDEMLRYLHVQVTPVSVSIANRMRQNGDFTLLLPNQQVPAIVGELEVAAAPEALALVAAAA
eukprot:scaffold57235_cov58-Attheya_sp.AAC.8